MPRAVKRTRTSNRKQDCSPCKKMKYTKNYIEDLVNALKSAYQNNGK